MAREPSSQGEEEQQPKSNMPIKERHAHRPNPSLGNENSGSAEYESEELTPRLQKRPHGEEEDDLDYDPRGDVEREGPHVEPEENPTHDPNEDGKEQWLEVQQCTLRQRSSASANI